MARQLRIEYPGAFYHVTSRGNRKEPIFLTDHDREALLEYFKDANKKFDAIVHAYCLMKNHYHLLLHTLRANLSKIMHFINTSYTILFNTRHSRVGHLFQGRFRAILVEADNYAQELSRYIHLNPVRAKIVTRPEAYEWSSYQTYLGAQRSEPWLNTHTVLGYFDRNLIVARKKYAAFVTAALGKEIESPLEKAVSSLILGSNDFVDKIKADFIQKRSEQREVPAIRKLKEKPSIEIIQKFVGQALGAENRLARNIAIFLCHTQTDYALKEISEYFSIGKSSIGNICREMRQKTAQNEFMRSAMDKIANTLFNHDSS